MCEITGMVPAFFLGRVLPVHRVVMEAVSMAVVSTRLCLSRTLWRLGEPETKGEFYESWNDFCGALPVLR